ncbi:MAG: EamA family transporter [Candidatus Pacebacteria bacterium]|nr:EamA family transporter [Candidatus Paceibacterota bacterium]
MNRLPAKTVIFGVTAALINVLCWGAAPAIIKFGLETVSPTVFLYYRFVLVIALTTPFMYAFRKHIASSVKTPQHLVTLLLIGILTNPLNLGILFLGLHYTTSASAAILASVSPLFIMAASALFLKERITKFELLGAAIATLGTCIIILDTPTQSGAANPLLGNLLIFTYNIVWTAGALLMKKYATTYHPFLFGYTGWFTGMILFGLIVMITEPYFFFRPLMLTQLPQAFFSILYMAVFGSIIGFTSYQVAQKHLSASKVSIFTYLQPIVVLPLSVFWLKEKFGVQFILGAMILAIGVCIAEMHQRSRLRTLHHKPHKKAA